MFNIAHYWYRKSLHPITLALLPFSWLFGLGVSVRRGLYRTGVIKTQRFTVPIIVVGNITVGGTGKTPFVIWLANFLQSQGYCPGIVSRGVGGKKQAKPYWVKPGDTPEEVGDEALLLMRNTGCPVVIGIDRAAVVRDLLQQTACDIVISDDGLQHYRLGRDIEIAIVDGERCLGNQYLLPAGPLRESSARLKKVDFVVVNGGGEQSDVTMLLEPLQLVSLQHQQEISMADFPHKKVHAVAGIGHPERFFNTLKNAGFDVITHSFPDHYLYQSQDLGFTDSYPILMTEKDAVKCKRFADERYWYLKITAKMNAGFEQQLLQKIKHITEVCDDSEVDFAKRPCTLSHCVQQHDHREQRG